MDYPQGFLEKPFHLLNREEAISTSNTKLLIQKLHFIGDTAGDVLSDRQSRAVKGKFDTANLCLTFSTGSMVTPQLMNKLPGSATSTPIYGFSCFCEESHVESTTRQLMNSKLS